MTSSSDDRLAREAAFHDVTFADGTRARAAKFYAVTDASTARYRDAILEDVWPGARVLEYGCGPGTHAFELARAGADFVGIDISPVAIDLAREHAHAEGLDLRLEVMDAEALTFPADSFDLVCGTGVLHHLDLERALREISRVLKPNGKAVFFEPLGHNPLINLYRRRTPEMRTVDEHPLLVSDLDLAKRRFDSVKAEYFHLAGLTALALRRTRAFQPALRVLDGFDRALFRRLPVLRRYGWMVVLQLGKPRAA